ncbi:MAG: DM13 domain-containing protein, partial [Chloroflexota bacterium]|nr:DM13 domain-containing protein [Chloroflexota bacterium]
PPPPPPPSPTPTPFAPATVATGSFVGTDEFHFGRGTASIVEIEPGRYRLRLDDFSVRNGPDLFVYLSPSAEGYADDAVELGKLKATDGSFGYDLPKGVDPADFGSAIIWCKQFSHLFTVAPFGG